MARQLPIQFNERLQVRLYLELIICCLFIVTNIQNSSPISTFGYAPTPLLMNASWQPAQ